MKVEQFRNLNQFHMWDNYNDYLQSYDSLVVSITYNPGCIQCIILGKDWDYSKTTSKHVYQFLEEFSKINIPYNCKNKKAYINKLIEDCKKDKREFADKHNFIIHYDESMC